MILTNEIFEKGTSRNGAWSGKQLALFGIIITNNKGWKKTIIGHDWPKETINRFISLKDKHLKVPLTQMSLLL